MTNIYQRFCSAYRLRSAGIALVLLGILATGCETPSPDPIRSQLEGRITVRSSVDTSGNYDGFRVLVLNAQGRSIDTLGIGVTDRKGHFAMTVEAPERGVYPLTIWGRRGQQRLATTEFVVAEGDSATLKATFPLNRRRLRVRSSENSAFAGYRNTLAQHRRAIVKQLQTDATDSIAMSRRIRQTSSVLWSLRETFPGTYAGQLAATESLSLLDGWNDSLLVARARTIRPANPRYVEAVQIARRAVARRHGQAAALALLDTFKTRAQTDPQRAGVDAVRVQAFIDSLKSEAALSTAQNLKNDFPDTKWAEWADGAMYEVNNLMPGATAPNVTAQTVSGDSVSLRDLRGHPVVLEYYRPGNDLFARQLATRNTLYQATRPDSVSFLSVSVDPDTLLYRAFVDNRTIQGTNIIAPSGTEDSIATAYNVVDVPTRYLIDADGTIVGQYEGAAFLSLQEDLTRMLGTSQMSP